MRQIWETWSGGDHPIETLVDDKRRNMSAINWDEHTKETGCNILHKAEVYEKMKGIFEKISNEITELGIITHTEDWWDCYHFWDAEITDICKISEDGTFFISYNGGRHGHYQADNARVEDYLITDILSEEEIKLVRLYMEYIKDDKITYQLKKIWLELNRLLRTMASLACKQDGIRDRIGALWWFALKLPYVPE